MAPIAGNPNVIAVTPSGAAGGLSVNAQVGTCANHSGGSSKERIDAREKSSRSVRVSRVNCCSDCGLKQPPDSVVSGTDAGLHRRGRTEINAVWR